MDFKHRSLVTLLSIICMAVTAAPSTKKPIRPRTVNDAVHIIKSKWLSKSDLDWILRNPEDQVSAQLHHGLGTTIRNEFGLWGDNKQLRTACGEEHPDNCSGVIISALWKSIRSDNDPELVKQLDIQFKLLSEIPITYTGFRELRTGEWLASLNSQIEAYLIKVNEGSSSKISFSIHVVGDPNSDCYSRAEFSEDGKGPKALGPFLGWFSWRNSFTVRHDPPFIEFNFTKKCAWPKRPEGMLYQQ